MKSSLLETKMEKSFEKDSLVFQFSKRIIINTKSIYAVNCFFSDYYLIVNRFFRQKRVKKVSFVLLKRTVNNLFFFICFGFCINSIYFLLYFKKIFFFYIKQELQCNFWNNKSFFFKKITEKSFFKFIRKLIDYITELKYEGLKFRLRRKNFLLQKQLVRMPFLSEILLLKKVYISYFFFQKERSSFSKSHMLLIEIFFCLWCRLNNKRF